MDREDRAGVTVERVVFIECLEVRRNKPGRPVVAVDDPGCHPSLLRTSRTPLQKKMNRSSLSSYSFFVSGCTYSPDLPNRCSLSRKYVCTLAWLLTINEDLTLAG